MDPTTIATEAGKLVLSKAAASASGKFIDKAWDNASKWLTDKFRGHSKEVKEKAEKNSESFLNNAGKQLQVIVQNSQNSPVTIQLMNDNFKDPDFSAVLQEATIASARTDSEEKHILLARLIAERVTAKPENMVSLVSSSAIEAIRKLSSKHLHTLGLAGLIYQIRPVGFPTNLPPEIVEQHANNWWNSQLSAMLAQAQELNHIDMRHLVSVSCIDHNTIFSHDLNAILKSGFGEWNTQKYLDESEQGKKLLSIFKSTLEHITLTSTGMLIGVLVHDQVVGHTTVIDW